MQWRAEPQQRFSEILSTCGTSAACTSTVLVHERDATGTGLLKEAVADADGVSHSTPAPSSRGRFSDMAWSHLIPERFIRDMIPSEAPTSS